MKKTSLLAILALLLMVSCKSKEDKALELIDKELFNTLYDYKSYEPVQTEIDSAFTSIYRDSLIRSKVLEIFVFSKLAKKYTAKVEEALGVATRWKNNSSLYGREEFNDVIKEANDNIKMSQETAVLWKSKNKEIAKLADEFQPKFCGWKMNHKYRVKTKGGYSDLVEYVYILSESIEIILDRYDLNDENEILRIKTIDDIVK